MLGAFDRFHFDLKFVPSSRFRNFNHPQIAQIGADCSAETIFPVFPAFLIQFFVNCATR